MNTAKSQCATPHVQPGCPLSGEMKRGGALPSADAYALAKHRARYAHKRSVVWQAADGWHVADYDKTSVRAAMLAQGTQGRFSVVTATSTVRTGWRSGVNQLRSFGLAGMQ